MSGATAKALIDYIHASPTPFHLVQETGQRLLRAGFQPLKEADVWKGKLEPGGKYFFSRNSSTIVAFVVGGAFKAGNSFKVIGAHSDSPVLKVKPVSAKSAHGYMQLGAETYGGGLWHTWFDRELTLAGRAILENEGGFESRLLNVGRPILRVPNLCIHLQTSSERASFAPNKETHLSPVMAMTEGATASLNEMGEGGDDRHAPALLSILADSLDCKVDAIKDLELTLCDTQPGAVWGAAEEFVSSPRLDNQAHCFTSLQSLLTHAGSEKLGEDDACAMIVMYDHEEIGSQSAQGAASLIFRDALSRITSAFHEGADAGGELFKVAIRKSFLISADVAHAIHPNYAAKHESKHSPILNSGTVIKTNDNQRYATDSVSGFFFRECARRAGERVQEFVVRNDCPCGTTIGPLVSTNTGIRCVDVGIPSLSMHSIRETVGSRDISNNIAIFESFFANYNEILASFKGFE